jgi:hypothetical protein
MRLLSSARLAALGGLTLLVAACGPKTTGGGGANPTPAVSATPAPTPTPSRADLGLSLVRSLWNDPPVRTGERVRWQVTPAEPTRLLDEKQAVASSSGDATFSAAGGTFLGNEVLRVPAGEFRARHGVIAKDGATWHLYLVRTVPGGVAKAEKFLEGEMDPALVYELDEFVRLPRRPADPAP